MSFKAQDLTLILNKPLMSGVQVEDEGELFYSLDDGHTQFTDLIQLVDFYQLNRGVLPCRLKHHCAKVALWTREPHSLRSGAAELLEPFS